MLTLKAQLSQIQNRTQTGSNRSSDPVAQLPFSLHPPLLPQIQRLFTNISFFKAGAAVALLSQTKKI